jgi:hypothetical protein
MEIKWKQLKTIKGTAVNVPKFLEEILTSENERQAQKTWFDLKQILIKNGEWVTSAAPTIRALLAQLNNAKFPEFIYYLIADIVAADCNDLWLMRSTINPNEHPLFKDCIDAISENRSVLIKSLSSDNGLERAGAATVLGATLGFGSWELKALESQFDVETNPLVKATLLCALELADKSGQWTRKIEKIAIEGDENLLVWGFAALSSIRNKKNALSKVSDGIEALLMSEIKNEEFLLFPGLSVKNHFHALGDVLLVRGCESKMETVAELIEFANNVKNKEVNILLGITFDILMGNDLEDVVIPFNELDEIHRFVAKGLADTWVYPQNSWMPSAGSTRRRWLGIDKPSILELPAPTGIDSQFHSRPLWQVFLELDENLEKTQLMPEVVEQAFNATDQWWITAVIQSNAYGISKRMDWDVLEKCGESLVINDETEKTIHMLCRDALIRQHVPGFCGGNYVISRLLLLPLVRAGREIPQEFYPLVLFRDKPVERKILAVVDKNYLSKFIIEELNNATPVDVFSSAEDFLSIVDVVSFPDVCKALVKARDIMSKSSAEKYGKMLLEKAESVPELKRALGK